MFVNITLSTHHLVLPAECSREIPYAPASDVILATEKRKSKHYCSIDKEEYIKQLHS